MTVRNLHLAILKDQLNLLVGQKQFLINVLHGI